MNPENEKWTTLGQFSDGEVYFMAEGNFGPIEAIQKNATSTIPKYVVEINTNSPGIDPSKFIIRPVTEMYGFQGSGYEIVYKGQIDLKNVTWSVNYIYPNSPNSIIPSMQ